MNHIRHFALKCDTLIEGLVRFGLALLMMGMSEGDGERHRDESTDIEEYDEKMSLLLSIGTALSSSEHRVTSTSSHIF